MKSITYMMQYLMSILSPKISNSKNKETIQKIEDMEKRLDTLEANMSEAITCIQELAHAFTGLIAQAAAAPQKDPLDEILKNSTSDDDGSGYLH